MDEDVATPGGAEDESPLTVEAAYPSDAPSPSAASAQAELPFAGAHEPLTPEPPTPLEERAAADVHQAAALHPDDDGGGTPTAHYSVGEEDGGTPASPPAFSGEAPLPPPRPPSPPSPPCREALPDASPAPRAPAGLRRTSTGSVPGESANADAALAAALADAAAARAELADVRAEYDAMRVSTAEVCEQLQRREEEAEAARLRLCEESGAASTRLARAEAALERERARAVALADAAAAERATAEVLRAQLAAADADAALARADLGALRAELNRLRDATAMQQRSAELSGAADEEGGMQREPGGAAASQEAAEEVAELRRRADAASALVEKLMVDNDTLTELVNEQAQILSAVRAARLSAQQGVPRPQRVDEDQRSPVAEQPQSDSEDEVSAAEAAAEPEPTRDEATPQEASQPTKPQRWMLGRVWAHIAGYDDVPARGAET